VDSRKVSAAVLVVVLLAYHLPHAFPSPQLAFYVARGWLGVGACWLIWRRAAVTWPVLAAVAVYEASTSVCGVAYVGAPAVFGGICDSGSGLPFNLLGLVGVLAAAVHLKTRGSSTGNNEK